MKNSVGMEGLGEGGGKEIFTPQALTAGRADTGMTPSTVQKGPAEDRGKKKDSPFSSVGEGGGGGGRKKAGSAMAYFTIRGCTLPALAQGRLGLTQTPPLPPAEKKTRRQPGKRGDQDKKVQRKLGPGISRGSM